jgi:type I restriction-modification system DNA methylase subunit
MIARRNPVTTPQTRRNREVEIAGRLGAFIDELTAVRILDPACGSGNLLVTFLRR